MRCPKGIRLQKLYELWQALSRDGDKVVPPIRSLSDHIGELCHD